MAALDVVVEQRALAVAHFFNTMAPVRSAYVFGSHAEGTPHQWSDIDVALFLDGVETWDMGKRARAMYQAQKAIGLDIEAHLFSSAQLERPQPASFAHYVLTKGVRLPFSRKSS